jgi:hypothetical protein
MKFGSVEVKGKKFDIEVGSDGKFGTNSDGSWLKADTLDQLKTKLATQISRAKLKLSIPFCRWVAGGRLRKGIITGIHASNNNILVKFDDEKTTEQEDIWYSGGAYIDPEHAGELDRLGKACMKASQEYDDFVDKHKFNAKEAVRKAMGNKADEVGEIDD